MFMMNVLSIFDCKLNLFINSDKHDDRTAVVPGQFNLKFQTKIPNQN